MNQGAPPCTPVHCQPGDLCLALFHSSSRCSTVCQQSVSKSQQNLCDHLELKREASEEGGTSLPTPWQASPKKWS